MSTKVAADFVNDLRFTLRSMRGNLLLAIVVVTTLVLGIGISTGIFTLLSAIALRARVDHDPDSYVQVFAAYTADSKRPGRPGPPTLDDYTAFRERARSLRDVAAWQNTYAPLGSDDPIEVRGLLVTCNFFALHTLTQPRLGRLLQADDCASQRPVMVLSEELWRTRFAADPAIVGQVIRYNNQPFTIAGVAPSPFAGSLNRSRLWIPYTLQTYIAAPVPKYGSSSRLDVAARLQAGFSRRDAAAELALIGAQQDRLQPGRTTAITVTDGSFLQQPSFDQKTKFVIPLITGVVSLIVILASVNVTTLLLARADARQHEIAIRLAIGASRTRLLQMLLTETLVLTSVAAVASLYLANWIPGPVHIWLTGEAAEYPLHSDWRVIIYLGVITIMAAAIAGLAPASQAMSVNLVDALKGRRRVLGSPGSKSRLHGLLVSTQVALSMVLLVGAGVFVRAHLRMVQMDPGFETRRALAAFLRPGSAAPTAWSAVHSAVAGRVQSLPSVVSLSWATSGPAGGSPFDIQLPGGSTRRIETNSVSPEFFSALSIPILRGRTFDRTGPINTGVQPAIVSEQFVREFSPKEDVLGRTFRSADGHVIEVIGVARDTAVYGDTDGAIVYRPWSDSIAGGVLIVRFAGDGDSMARAVSAAIRESQPAFSVVASTFEAQMEGSLTRFWHLATLILMLGAVGLLLALLGIYGVISFSARRRYKEVGIRVALGAARKDIFAAVLRPGLRSLAMGLVTGLGLALALSPALARVLDRVPFPINPRDPLAYTAVALVLAATAVGAMLMPATRAASVDPVKALRDE